jgi:hypothetical protein
VIITRRSLLVALGLALPVAAVATAATADTTIRPHHARKHGHLAHAHHHGKPHRTASTARRHRKHV